MVEQVVSVTVTIIIDMVVMRDKFSLVFFGNSRNRNNRGLFLNWIIWADTFKNIFPAAGSFPTISMVEIMP